MSLDWERARQRLAAGLTSIERALAPEREHIAAVYLERAARLARPAAEEAESETSVLVLRLGPERFGIELVEVVEVLAAAERVAVPGARPELAGIVNVRGVLRPVWDLRRLLNMPEPAAAGGASIVLVRRAGRAAGLLADRVEEIRSLPAGELQAAAPPYAKRLAADGVVVLDTAELFREIST